MGHITSPHVLISRMQIPIPLVVHRVIRLTSGRIIRRIFPSDHGIRQRQYRPVTWLEMLVFHDTSIGARCAQYNLQWHCPDSWIQVTFLVRISGYGIPENPNSIQNIRLSAPCKQSHPPIRQSKPCHPSNCSLYAIRCHPTNLLSVHCTLPTGIP